VALFFLNTEYVAVIEIKLTPFTLKVPVVWMLRCFACSMDADFSKDLSYSLSETRIQEQPAVVHHKTQRRIARNTWIFINVALRTYLALLSLCPKGWNRASHTHTHTHTHTQYGKVSLQHETIFEVMSYFYYLLTMWISNVCCNFKDCVCISCLLTEPLKFLNYLACNLIFRLCRYF
jgi:hypothetical protein